MCSYISSAAVDHPSAPAGRRRIWHAGAPSLTQVAGCLSRLVSSVVACPMLLDVWIRCRAVLARVSAERTVQRSLAVVWALLGRFTQLGLWCSCIFGYCIVD